MEVSDYERAWLALSCDCSALDRSRRESSHFAERRWFERRCVEKEYVGEGSLAGSVTDHARPFWTQAKTCLAYWLVFVVRMRLTVCSGLPQSK